MRFSSHFLSFLGFIFIVVSYADSQEQKSSECVKMNETFNYLSERMNELKKQLSELDRNIEFGQCNKNETNGRKEAHFNSSIEYYDEPDYTWTIDDFKTKANRTNFKLLSEVFPLKGYSFGAQVKLTLEKNNFLLIGLSYKNIKQSGKALNLRLIPEVKYTYKDEPSNDRIREPNYLIASVLQYDSFYYHDWLVSPRRIANDTISIDVHVEPPEAALRGYSYDGSLAWAIDDYWLKRKMAAQRLVHHQDSPRFYTGPKGYRVRIRWRLVGFGQYYRKGLTADVNFLTGPYDADLSQTFKHNTTITLFCPADPTKVILKSVVKDLKDVKSYMIDVGTHAEIDNLLDGDTLHYLVKIIPA